MKPMKHYQAFKDFNKHCEHKGTWIGSCHHPQRYNGNIKIEDCLCFKAEDCPLKPIINK
jgi:hypothetical protein